MFRSPKKVHHPKIMIKIKPGTRESDVWLVRARIIDMHRVGETGWPEKRQVQIEVSPSRKPYVQEMGKLLRWLKKMKVNERISVEWRPPCSTATKRREKYLPYSGIPQDGKSRTRFCKSWSRTCQSLWKG